MTAVSAKMIIRDDKGVGIAYPYDLRSHLGISQNGPVGHMYGNVKLSQYILVRFFLQNT